MLPKHYESENLYSEIRETALDYFRQNGIRWHMLNHLCSSQVCCVNFLFPFMDKPEALAALLRPLFPSLKRMLPLETPQQFVAFEWIGNDNYLREKIRRSVKRTRGANFTSADAMVMFEGQDKLRQLVLIEWKYSESYGGFSKKISARGTDRSQIYAHLFEREDCPLKKSAEWQFADLFYEPFYQFMRQQFLAHEMELAKEFRADKVSLLHIAPACNSDFRKVTSPALQPLGASVIDVWKRLVKTPDRFGSISTEKMFGQFPAVQFPELAGWWQYLQQRYSWAVG